MRRLVASVVASFALIGQAGAQTFPSPVVNSIGIVSNQPTSADDVTRGIYPGMVWRSNGATWVNLFNGASQAVWEKQESVPLPGDAIGLYVSAAAVNAGGSGYIAGDVGKTLTLQGGVLLTIATVSAGAVATVTVTTPNMYGVCSPTTSAAPILAASAGTTGTGATFNLTLLYPTVYAVRRVSSCYTGNIVQVQNSVTSQTKDIAYRTDNSMDIDTAIAFGTSGSTIAMEDYANYNDGPVPGVSVWYDQGGNPSPNNATQSTVAKQPVLFSGRRFGNSVPVLFNSQGAVASQPYPAYSGMVIPAAVAFASTAAGTLSWAGGAVGYASIPLALTPVAGLSTAYFGIADSSNFPSCSNQNVAGNATVNGVGTPSITETPSMITCSWSGGALTADSTFHPTQSFRSQINSYTAGATYGITATTAGTGCPLVANRSVSYATSTSDSAQAAMLALVAAINADSTLAAAGITANVDLRQNFIINIWQPRNSTCTMAYTAVGGGSFVNSASDATGAGWATAGGFLGAATTAAASGNEYTGFVAVVPWTMTAAQMGRMRLAVNHHFDIDGHPGVVINTLVASNMSGYLTPFLQDVPNELPKLLGRTDAVVINKSLAGQSWAGNVATLATTGVFYRPVQFIKSGRTTNNITLMIGEFNGLTTAGSSVTENSSMQTAGAFYKSFTNTTVCAPEIAKNVTATQNAENVLLAALLLTNPGCDYNVGILSIPLLNNQTGPWNWPVFTKSGSGSHVSGQYAGFPASLYAEQIRRLIK